MRLGHRKFRLQQSPVIGAVKRKRLVDVLKLLDVQPPEGRHSYCLATMNPWELQDMYQQARATYHQLRKQMHPDVGGNTHAMAVLNTVWDKTERLFKRKGVEV